LARVTHRTTPAKAPASVSEFLDQFPRVDTYAEIDEILRSPDFIQGSHFESKPVFGGSLVVIDGPEHRQRRKMLMGMFSHAALRRNEKEILAPAIRHAFDALAATRGADGLVRVDLVPLLRSLTIVISAHVTGVDGAEEPARRARLQALVSKLEAASGVEWSTRDHVEVMADGVAARRELIREFLQPALDRRIALAARVRAGAPGVRPADGPAGPAGAARRDGQGGEDAQIWRECALFLVAGTQTTSHALPHIVWHLDPGGRRIPDTAPGLPTSSSCAVPPTSRCACTSRCLRCCASPRATPCSNVMGAVPPGERIALFFSAANRDADLYGADVDSFDPLRPVQQEAAAVGPDLRLRRPHLHRPRAGHRPVAPV
jgi:cytochrome P450